MDDLGRPAREYRDAGLRGFSDGRVTSVPPVTSDLLDLAQRFVESSLANSWRDDGLVHSYNVLELGDDRVDPALAPMLEGQVAMLSSRAAQPAGVGGAAARPATSACTAQTAQLPALPRQGPPRIPERNRFTPSRPRAATSSRALVAAGDRQPRGQTTSTATCTSPPTCATPAASRRARPARPRPRLARSRRAEPHLRAADLRDVFHHAEFTGDARARSSPTRGSAASTGTWCPSCCSPCRRRWSVRSREQADAEDDRAPCALRTRTSAPASGYCKSPASTARSPPTPTRTRPAGHGARQPGMTGQVKEEVLTRLGEVRGRVEDGLPAR
jgi:hypothetical protein